MFPVYPIALLQSATDPGVPMVSAVDASYCDYGGGEVDVWRLWAGWTAPPAGWEVEVVWGTDGSSYPNTLHIGPGGGGMHLVRPRGSTTYLRARFRRAKSGGGYEYSGWSAVEEVLVDPLYQCPPPVPDVSFHDLSGCSLDYELVVDFTISVSSTGAEIGETEVYAGTERIAYVGGAVLSGFQPPAEYRVQGQVFRVVHRRDGQSTDVDVAFQTAVVCTEPGPPLSVTATASGSGFARVVDLGWILNGADSSLQTRIARYDGLGDPNDASTWNEIATGLAWNATSFTDDAVTPGNEYRYAVQHSKNFPAWSTGWGYSNPVTP